MKVAEQHVISDEHAVTQQSDSALRAAKRNLRFLYDPKNSPHPTRFRTRALLRSLRYLTIFVFWRLVRWAKYIAIGSLVAAVSASALGGVVTGAAWIAAPPTIGASILSLCVWQTGKFAGRKLHARWKRDGGEVGEEARERENDKGADTYYAAEPPLQAVPW